MAATRTLLNSNAPSRLFYAATASCSDSIASTSSHSRFVSTSAIRHVVSKFTMPAMSPTMMSGGIATWKLKEGQSFSAGDVLLEIETDKATMDVEAQEDGVLAKILVQQGAKDVDVGKTIALLAEEGDDLSNIEIPIEQDSAPILSTPSSSSPSTSTSMSTNSSQATSSVTSSHSHVSFDGPLFPSVQRLLAENHIQDAKSKIKGTGIRGMITKGDVLAFLGKAQGPTGTFKPAKSGIAVLGPQQSVKSTGKEAKSVVEPLSSDDLRSLILGGLASATASKRAGIHRPAIVDLSKPIAQQALESALEGYHFTNTSSTPKTFITRKDGIRSNDPLWDLF